MRSRPHDVRKDSNLKRGKSGSTNIQLVKNPKVVQHLIGNHHCNKIGNQNKYLIADKLNQFVAKYLLKINFHQFFCTFLSNNPVGGNDMLVEQRQCIFGGEQALS